MSLLTLSSHVLGDSSPWVEESSNWVEGLAPALVRNPGGALSILSLIIPEHDPQRTPFLINFLNIMDSRGMRIAVGLVQFASGWGFDWRTHGKWVCCLIDHF